MRATLELSIAGSRASLVPGAALGPATFQGLGLLPDEFPSTEAYGLSGDGRVAAGPRIRGRSPRTPRSGTA